MQKPKRLFRLSAMALLFGIELLLAINIYSALRHYRALAGEDQPALQQLFTIAQLQTAIPITGSNQQQLGETSPGTTPTLLVPTLLIPTRTPQPPMTRASTPSPLPTPLPPTPAPPTPAPPIAPTATLYYVTPTPAAPDLFGAATQVAQLTADARSTGTATPLPAHWRVYTVRILPYVPPPANQATAEFLALEATARAVTTGEPPAGILVWTATPRPTNTPPPTVPPSPTPTATQTPIPSATATTVPSPTATATPFVITATVTPESVLAAATLAARTTQEAATTGTPTPLPPNAVTATFTPRPIIVTNTPTAANGATATAMAVEATAIAFTTGTPDTRRFITATATPTRPVQRGAGGPPTRTPTPFLFALSELTATPTPVHTPSFPPILIGKILFLGDFDGRGAPEAYVMDPDGSNLLRLSGRAFYDRAAERDSDSSDRRFRAFVKREEVGTRERQIYAYDAFYNSERQLTNMKDGSTSWDPAWSPIDERIAFVSNQTDNDEIWVVERTSGAVVQLTFNDGPWDKHPSWSPDGRHIVFMSSRTGHRAIWIMESDGSNQRQLTHLDFETWDPVWVKYGDQ